MIKRPIWCRFQNRPDGFVRSRYRPPSHISHRPILLGFGSCTYMNVVFIAPRKCTFRQAYISGTLCSMKRAVMTHWSVRSNLWPLRHSGIGAGANNIWVSVFGADDVMFDVPTSPLLTEFHRKRNLAFWHLRSKYVSIIWFSQCQFSHSIHTLEISKPVRRHTRTGIHFVCSWFIAGLKSTSAGMAHRSQFHYPGGALTLCILIFNKKVTVTMRVMVPGGNVLF